MYWLLLLSVTFPPLKILANDKPCLLLTLQKMLCLSFAPVSIVFKWKFSLLTSHGLKQGHLYWMMAIYLFKGELTCAALSIIYCVFNGHRWVCRETEWFTCGKLIVKKSPPHSEKQAKQATQSKASLSGNLTQRLLSENTLLLPSRKQDQSGRLELAFEMPASALDILSPANCAVTTTTHLYA